MFITALILAIEQVFSAFTSANFFGNLFKESEKCVAVAAVSFGIFTQEHILYYSIVSDTCLWDGALPFMIRHLPFLPCRLFLSVFVHLRFAIAIGRFMCSLNWKCSTMDGSRQQCHHSKLTKEPSLQLAKFSRFYSHLCTSKQTRGERNEESSRSGVWVFHVKFFIGMSEKCTCFNDFGIFVWRLLNRCVRSVCCQKFNCTNALFHLLNKGNICTVSCIYSTCQVVGFLPVELLCVTS